MFPTVITDGGKLDPASMQATLNQLYFNLGVKSLSLMTLSSPQVIIDGGVVNPISLQYIINDLNNKINALGSSSIAPPAADIYVSLTGDDFTGAGSSISPFRTLAKACAVATTGKSIYVYPGKYIEYQQSVVATGVTIFSSDKNTCEIGCGLSSGSQTNTWIYLGGNSEGVNGNQSVHDITFTGLNRFASIAMYVRGRSNVKVYNCTFKDFNDSAIQWSGLGNETDGPPTTTWASGNEFHDNVITNSSAYNESGGTSFGNGCICVGGQVGFLLYNNTITQTARPNAQNGYCIKYYRQGYNKGLHIYNNIINKNSQSSYYDFAIEMWNSYGLEIDHNTISGNVDLAGLGKDIYAYSASIHHNNWTKNGDPLSGFSGCLEYEVQNIGGYSDTIVYSNTAIGVFQFFRALCISTSTTLNNHVFYNNLIIGGRFTSNWSGGSLTNTFSNWKFYNNTMDGKGTALDGLQITANGALSTNWEVINNIIVNYTRDSINTQAALAGYLQENNIQAGNGNNTRTDYAAAPTGVTTSGNQTSALSTYSQFTNSAINDYTLQNSSPALGSYYVPTLGITAINTGIGVDILGATRTIPYTIGAYNH